MAYKQMRYKLEDGKIVKNVFPSDAEMNGWALDPDTAMKGPEEVKQDDDSSTDSLRSGGASKGKTDKRKPSSS